ncbi:RWD domain-containing protein [Bisporella sp. PMI_857]|nr:RWD domain-containing protein [Bisporella sp. PMI_857]
MSEDLLNEIEAVNSIYGEGTLLSNSEANIYVLHLPARSISLRLHFSDQYPEEPPAVLGTESSGEDTRRGEGKYVADTFRDSVGRLFQPGEVCLYDVIEEVNMMLDSVAEQDTNPEHVLDDAPDTDAPLGTGSYVVLEPPPWTLSDVVIELKSVFIARCASVSSPNQANQYLQHLLDSDKKIRSATHNITAWRIKGANGITFQDCDDDGETAAGGRVLHLLQLLDIWNVMVVVTRWYGGHQLGPKRFSIINSVARDACIKGGFVADETTKKKGRH